MALIGYRVLGLWVSSQERFDAHLLAGDASLNLFEILSVHYLEIHDDREPVTKRTSAEDATTAPAAGGEEPVRIRFTAGFAGSDVDPHHALGVTFDPDLGIVTADDPLPTGTRIQNLLVKAIATARNGAEHTTAELWIRVHVHEWVARMWLTPNPLTIREAASMRPRLTLLAEFDDGVVADITLIRNQVPAWDGRVTWSSDRESVVEVGENGLLGAGTGGDATITASYQPPGGGGPIEATARVRVVEPWSSGAEVTLVSGDADRRARVPNILFLAEGFDASDDDRNAFNRIVGVVVDGLRKNHLIYPWPMLHGSVNFWSAFTPGREAGVTQRAEVYVENPDAEEMEWARVPTPIAPRVTAQTWNVRNLVHEIGLPVPFDDGRALDELLPQLRTRFGEHVTKDKIKDAFGRWILLANRRLFNDRDSGLFLVSGARPRAKVPKDDDPTMLDRDGDRIGNDDLQAFLESMNHNGTVIGTEHWGPSGKDRGLVCMLARGSGRSAAYDDFFVASLARRKKERATRGMFRQLDIVPLELAEADDLDWLVYLFAHECGHAFGLGDEYGERDTEKGDEYERFVDSDAASIEEYPNLHARATLRKAGAPEEIDAALVKWASWLRIAEAAVLSTVPTAAGGEVRLRVQAGATRFAVGDRVRLRQVLLHRNGDNELEYRNPQRSGPLKVKSRPNDTFLVLEADGVPGDGETPLDDIGTTAMDEIVNPPVIVYKPARHPSPSFVGPAEFPVLPPLVQTHISTTDRPLNAAPDGPYVCVIDDSPVQQARNLPAQLKPCYTPIIIGLYDGGARYHCDVFHPGGICMMRDHTEGAKHRRFCHVCRYVLVDMIDPTKHGALDAVYFTEYGY